MKLQSDGAEWQVDVDPSWPGFAGHFPGNPLVPAAEMVAWVLQIASQRGFSGSTIQKARFLAPVRPNDSLRLNVTEKQRALAVIISRGHTVVAELTIS